MALTEALFLQRYEPFAGDPQDPVTRFERGHPVPVGQPARAWASWM